MKILFDAIVEGNLEEVIRILTQENPKLDERGPLGNFLHYAAMHGRKEIIEALITEGLNPNEKNDFGDTPLHSAATDGHIGAMLALIQHGATLNGKNDEEDTPLHQAVINGKIAAVKALIEAKADLLVKNKKDNTPLDVAIDWDGREIVTMLLGRLSEIELANATLYLAVKKIYDDAIPLLQKGTAEDKKAIKVSLNAANKVMRVMLNEKSTDINKTDALDALKQNMLTVTHGKPSTWKKFIGALTALVGVVILALSIAGIPFTGGASLAGMYVAGSLIAIGGAGFFAHSSMQRGLFEDLSHLGQVAASKPYLEC